MPYTTNDSVPFNQSLTAMRQPGSLARPEDMLDVDHYDRSAWIIDGCEFLPATPPTPRNRIVASPRSPFIPFATPDSRQPVEPQLNCSTSSEIQCETCDHPLTGLSRSEISTRRASSRFHSSLYLAEKVESQLPLPSSFGAAATFLEQQGAIHLMTVFQSQLISAVQDPDSPPGFPLVPALPLFERATTVGLDHGWSAAMKYFRTEPSVLRLAKEYCFVLSSWNYQFTQPFLRECRAERGDELRMADIHLLVRIRHTSSKRWAVAASGAEFLSSST